MYLFITDAPFLECLLASIDVLFCYCGVRIVGVLFSEMLLIVEVVVGTVNDADI